MKAFSNICGIVAPLDQANIDTDQIIPKQFLKSIQRTGFGPNLFDEWRYLDQGFPGQDYTIRPKNTEFVLNQSPYDQAEILLTRANFGCGSSREHAPWALEDFGFRVIIAPSFADIFYNNCFKNGILPLVLPEPAIDALFLAVLGHIGLKLSVDLPSQTLSIAAEFIDQVVLPPLQFEIAQSRKQALLKGLDEIGETLESANKIKAFQSQYAQQNPWLFQTETL